MSGPYPPPGQQRPADDNGWWAGQQRGRYGFPAVPYTGLGGPGWGGGQPPRKPRNTTRIVIAVVSVLIIVGGIVAGIVLVNQRHQEQATEGPRNAADTTTVPATESPTSSVNPDDPGVPNGSTTLTLAAGACVTAHVDNNEQYTAVQQVQCGSPQSDLVLAQVMPDMTGCADHQYLRLSAPSTAVDCFTLDIRQGDCVDANYLKTPCPGASFKVLQTQQGPGNADSCAATTGATHWVPVGRNPVRVGCLGPPN
jgi:hypothetical protein